MLVNWTKTASEIKSNIRNYIEKTCSQKYRLRGVRFITRLNTFACVWARGRTIACLS